MKLLALHGFAGGPSVWVGLAATGMDLEAPWLPGHGPRAPMAGDFDDVVAALARRLDGSYVVAGYSLGARLALALALAFPEKVERALLLGGTPGIEDEATRAARRSWDEAQAQAIERDLSGWADRWAALPIFASQAKLSAEARAAQQRQRIAHDPAGLAWAMRTLGQGHMPNLWPRLRSMTRPVLFVAGADDPKYVAIGERAAAMTAKATVEVVPDCGHNPLLERPDVVARLLRR